MGTLGHIYDDYISKSSFSASYSSYYSSLSLLPWQAADSPTSTAFKSCARRSGDDDVTIMINPNGITVS